MLDNPNEPVSDLSYFDCIESVMENSKVNLPVLGTLFLSIGKNLVVLCVHLPVAALYGYVYHEALLWQPLLRCFSNLTVHQHH